MTAFYNKEARANAPTLVIGPGYKAVLAKPDVQRDTPLTGETVMLSGFDKCPAQEGSMAKLFGPTRDEGRSDCIVLDKSRSSVKVQVAYLATRTVAVEQWAIKRIASPAGEQLSLIPPSGALLLEAPHQG